MKRILAICLAAWLATSTPTLTHAEDWVYTLRPGDELWTIARDFCGSGNLAATIARHNGITPATAIRAGQRINIPTNLLVFAPSVARIVRAFGDTNIDRGAGTAPVPANAGDVLQMGHTVITGAGAAVVSFADGSTIAVQPQSRVLFNKLTAFGPAGMVDTHLRFTYGRGKATVQPQNQGDRFRIQTPEGIAAVRGTEFRVGRKANEGVSNTETIEGHVVYAGSSQSADLPAGFGVAASARTVIREALLAPPAFLDQSTTAAVGQTLSWQAVSGAQTYVVTWSDGAAPDVVVQQYVVAGGLSTAVPVLPGAYQFAVRGVSANGIEGFDGTRRLLVVAAAPSLQQVAAQTAGTTEFSWDFPDSSGEYTLELNADHWPEQQIHTLRSPHFTIDLAAGNYAWRVKADNSAMAQTQNFTLLPATPTGVQTQRKKNQTIVTWNVQSGVTRYLLEITDPAGAVTKLETDEPTISLPTAAIGTYRIALASVQNSLQSEPHVIQVQVLQRPWWLTLFISILVI